MMAAVDEQVLDVLSLFYADPNMKSLAEIVNGTGHDRQAVRRRLQTLTDKGYLRRIELSGGKYGWTLTSDALLKLNRATDATFRALVLTAGRLVDQAKDVISHPLYVLPVERGKKGTGSLFEGPDAEQGKNGTGSIFKRPDAQAREF